MDHVGVWIMQGAGMDRSDSVLAHARCGPRRIILCKVWWTDQKVLTYARCSLHVVHKTGKFQQYTTLYGRSSSCTSVQHLPPHVQPHVPPHVTRVQHLLPHVPPSYTTLYYIPLVTLVFNSFPPSCTPFIHNIILYSSSHTSVEQLPPLTYPLPTHSQRDMIRSVEFHRSIKTQNCMNEARNI